MVDLFIVIASHPQAETKSLHGLRLARTFLVLTEDAEICTAKIEDFKKILRNK